MDPQRRRELHTAIRRFAEHLAPTINVRDDLIADLLRLALDPPPRPVKIAPKPEERAA